MYDLIGLGEKAKKASVSIAKLTEEQRKKRA